MRVCVMMVVLLSGGLVGESYAEPSAVQGIERVQGAFTAVFSAFKRADYTMLSRWVHERDGVTIHHSIRGVPVKFSRKDVRQMATDTTAHRFGTAAGSGAPVVLTGHAFFFGDRSKVPDAAGPLPAWKKIFRHKSEFAVNRPLSTAYEPGDTVPAAFKGLTYWTVRYPGTRTNEYRDASEVRLFFKKAGRLKRRLQARRAPATGYRLVGLVVAATYSP